MMPGARIPAPRASTRATTRRPGTREVKRIAKVPVVGVGRFTDPDEMVRVHQVGPARHHRLRPALDRRSLAAAQDRRGPASRTSANASAAMFASRASTSTARSSAPRTRPLWRNIAAAGIPEKFARDRAPVAGARGRRRARPAWNARGCWALRGYEVDLLRGRCDARRPSARCRQAARASPNGTASSPSASRSSRAWRTYGSCAAPAGSRPRRSSITARPRVVLATGARMGGQRARRVGSRSPSRRRHGAVALRDAGPVLCRQADRRPRRRCWIRTAISWPRASPRCWPTRASGHASSRHRDTVAPMTGLTLEGMNFKRLMREKGIGERVGRWVEGSDEATNHGVEVAALRSLSRRLAAHRRSRKRGVPAPARRCRRNSRLRQGGPVHRARVEHRALRRPCRAQARDGRQAASRWWSGRATAWRRATLPMRSSTATASRASSRAPIRSGRGRSSANGRSGAMRCFPSLATKSCESYASVGGCVPPRRDTCQRAFFQASNAATVSAFGGYKPKVVWPASTRSVTKSSISVCSVPWIATSSAR